MQHYGSMDDHRRLRNGARVVAVVWGRQTPGTRRIVPGMAVTDEVANRRGDEWIVALCAGDVVTISMQSEAFVPLVGIFEPDGEEPLALLQGRTAPPCCLPCAARAGQFLNRSCRRGLWARWTISLAVTTGDDAVQGVLDGILVPGQPLRRRCARCVRRRGPSTPAPATWCASMRPAPTSNCPSVSSRRAKKSRWQPVRLQRRGGHRSGAARRRRLYACRLRRRADQGDVELLLTVAATTTITPAPTATPALGMRCTVGAERLNLRSGPGLEFTPPIGVLSETPNYWLWRATRPQPGYKCRSATGDIGWTSAVAPFVSLRRACL